jgi:hypothetical protein
MRALRTAIQQRALDHGLILRTVGKRAEAHVNLIPKHSRWVFLLPLPLLHFGACATIALANLESGVQYIIYVDFPFSLILVMLGWRNDNFLFWFATLGTLWWYLLSWVAFSMLSKWKSS